MTIYTNTPIHAVDLRGVTPQIPQSSQLTESLHAGAHSVGPSAERIRKHYGVAGSPKPGGSAWSDPAEDDLAQEFENPGEHKPVSTRLQDMKHTLKRYACCHKPSVIGIRA